MYMMYIYRLEFAAIDAIVKLKKIDLKLVMLWWFWPYQNAVVPVFSHLRQVSSQSYRVQRRLKGQLWSLLTSFTLPTLPG